MRKDTLAALLGQWFPEKIGELSFVPLFVRDLGMSDSC